MVTLATSILALLLVPVLGLPQRSDNVFRMEMQPSPRDTPLCYIPDENSRFDCFPQVNEATQEKCEGRGCCWQSASSRTAQNVSGISVPYCFFPENYQGYVMSNLQETPQGYHATLSRTTQSGWPDDVMMLSLDVYEETETRLHFKIYDATQTRYEVPLKTPDPPAKKPADTDYLVMLKEKPFGIVVIRKSTGVTIFNSAIDNAPLIFADQFIQMSTSTGTGLVYGLGEHKGRLRHTADWQTLAMWARDHGPDFNTNLYGVHPFLLGLEDNGQAHGIFLLNSNAQEVLLQPKPALTFRTIGGILDFYVFTGPSPDAVIEQYTDVIGKPAMPPYWGLGFHLCRYGYRSSDDVKKVIARNRAMGIPYEAQWTDIDYMDHFRDWTYDHNAFGGLPDVVKDLHTYGQKYVIIVDPAISNQNPGQYPPYDEGVADDIFIKNASGQILVGAVWPGNAVFPDWTHPKVADWWYRQAKAFHDDAPFDGLWIDMNEPSNFDFGSKYGCTNNSLDIPPYVPGISGGNLASQTVCPSAKQFLSSHYNLHSMYGFGEGIASNMALTRLLNKRSIVISRSSFPGHGHYAGHWSGDNSATWKDLYYSIPVLLNFQMYGIPLVGADICGFGGNTTEELCIRWMQLGLFYPFMRNHNSIGSSDQDPAIFSQEAQGMMKGALELRYLLLPYMYTMFHRSHVTGAGVIRPLFFKYPQDPVTYDIDQQFMWGDALLISPALEENQRDVMAYFPEDKWYTVFTPDPPVYSKGQWMKLDAPLGIINFHLRGGSIIPVQRPDLTTEVSRTKPFSLLVALNSSGEALGELFWDDGDSLDTFEKGAYTSIFFTAGNNEVKSVLHNMGYKPPSGMTLEAFSIFGVTSRPSGVKVNGQAATSFDYEADLELLSLHDLELSLLSPLTVQWS